MKEIIFNNQSITPSKIVCIGRNYLEHINELNNEIPDDMVIFLKPNSAIGEQLLAVQGEKEQAEEVHFETEICFLYAKQRFSAVAVGLDLTKRALQSRLKNQGLPWERAKAFNGAALFSEFVAIDQVSDQLKVRLSVDGTLTQAGEIQQMIYSPAAILQELATFIDLEDGDIVMTGTPAGVGPVQAGSDYVCEVYQGDKLLVNKTWHAQ
ncbi:MAG: fumarylacetoacetate hydrolase family protein [Oceanospirillaceae bacterium]|nr:fumarylacetoacetate hydrolase family protein [Oceanospirillaceae bacterium]